MRRTMMTARRKSKPRKNGINGDQEKMILVEGLAPQLRHRPTGYPHTRKETRPA
jgi:hypothetical protein